VKLSGAGEKQREEKRREEGRERGIESESERADVGVYQIVYGAIVCVQSGREEGMLSCCS